MLPEMFSSSTQFHNGHADHERDIPGACDRQDRLRIHASRIRDDRPGCGDRDVSGGIGIEERIAAEVNRKGTVWIAPEHFFKGDLVCNSCFVVAARPVGKGHRSAALQPGGDGRDLRRIRDKAGGCQDHIVVDVFAFQLRQASRSAGHIGLGAALSGDGDGRLLCHMDAVGTAFHTVPEKIVLHGIPPKTSKGHLLTGGPLAVDCDQSILRMTSMPWIAARVEPFDQAT